MRYYVRRSVHANSSPNFMTFIGWFAIALAVFAAYQLYQRWDPMERPNWNASDGRSVEDHIREFELTHGRSGTRLMHHEDGQRNAAYGENSRDNEGFRHRDNDMYRPQHENTPYVPTKFRRKRLTPRQRRIVMERTNYCCSMCGSFCPVYDRELNHRISLSSNLYRYYDLNKLSNYELLCRKCHGLETYLQRQRGEFKH